MKKETVILLCCLLSLHDGFAQLLRQPLQGYLYTGVYNKSAHDILSFTCNQAALAHTTTAGIGFYSTSRYMLKELGIHRMAIALPSRAGAFGILGSYSGIPACQEIQSALAFARPAGNKVDIGLQFNYHLLRIPGYITARAITAECGILLKLSPVLQMGLHMNNPARGRWGKGPARLPAVYTTGLAYRPSGNVQLLLEINKEEDRPVSIGAAAVYDVLPQVSVKAGMAAGTASCWMGIGFSRQAIQLAVVTAWQPRLGITPSLLLGFDIHTQKREQGKRNDE